ncbi:MAG: hypothetical protein L0241_21730 [Planctomycetia bacterium]|nr:hypothetical protein [Planctomycetia bacterium]
MNYTVRWLRPAEAKLQALWLRAADPEVIAEAADAVNRILRDNPFDQGESRGRADHRVWFHPRCVSAFSSTMRRKWSTSRQ